MAIRKKRTYVVKVNVIETWLVEVQASSEDDARAMFEDYPLDILGDADLISGGMDILEIEEK